MPRRPPTTSPPTFLLPRLSYPEHHSSQALLNGSIPTPGDAAPLRRSSTFDIRALRRGFPAAPFPPDTSAPQTNKIPPSVTQNPSARGTWSLASRHRSATWFTPRKIASFRRKQRALVSFLFASPIIGPSFRSIESFCGDRDVRTRIDCLTPGAWLGVLGQCRREWSGCKCVAINSQSGNSHGCHEIHLNLRSNLNPRPASWWTCTAGA